MMQLWTFTVTSVIDDEGCQNAYYEIDGEVVSSELVGQLEIIKAQIIADTINSEGEDSEDSED